MKRANTPHYDASEMEVLMSVCCGMPRGDELPQVAGTEDIIADVYSEFSNSPRNMVSSLMHHQFEDEYSLDTLIH